MSRSLSGIHTNAEYLQRKTNMSRDLFKYLNSDKTALKTFLDENIDKDERVNRYLLFALAHIFNKSPHEIMVKRSGHQNSEIREICYYILKIELDLSYRKIMRMYNMKSQSPIYKSVQDMKIMMKSNASAFADKQLLVKTLQQSLREIFNS